MFGDPVLSGEAGIEHAIGDIARHLLGADQHALDLRIIDRRKVRPRARVDVESGAGEELNGGVLQRPLGQSELQSWHQWSSPAAGVEFSVSCASPSPMSRKKHDRSPVWQTLPSPRRVTRSSTVSSSQSLRMRRTCKRFPDVSPLVHSFPRLRLKNVAKPVLRVTANASSFMKPT